MTDNLGKKKWHEENVWRAVLSVVFFGVIIFTVYAIESNVDATVALGTLAPQNRLRHFNLHRPTTIDPGAIASWMTFDYLNMVFKMPPTYLKSALNITDARYPRLTIKHLSDDNKADPALILTEVKAAVQAFISTPKTVAQ